MPVRPNKGGGGSGSGSSTKASVGLANVDNTSDADKPISNAVKAVFDVIDPYANSRIFTDLNFSSMADVPKPLATGMLSTGLSTLVATEPQPHVGVFQINSGTTANSGGGLNLPSFLSTPSVLNQLICCFKTPATIDPNSIIIIGGYNSTVGGDRQGLTITGNSAVASVVSGGSTTAA